MGSRARRRKPGQLGFTVTGKIVYPRKPHAFKLSDAKRVIKAVLATGIYDTTPEFDESFEQNWVDLYLFLAEQLALQFRIAFPIEPTRSILLRMMKTIEGPQQFISALDDFLNKLLGQEPIK